MPICSICKKDEDNPVDYGEFMSKSDICVHYYCVLLSTNLQQAGLDCSGILGFLIRDIRKEIKEAEKRTCIYCNEAHASIACSKCKQYFHNICGNRNGCVSQFINEFQSFCHRHVPFREEKMLSQQKTPTCWICMEPLGAFSPTLTLRSYCCNNGYIHRHCLRKYALSAGYHLRCIWCTSKAFLGDVRKHGVFVPDREAAWDNNETQRFVDLHRGYSQCDAKVCLCPQGREFFRKQWKLMVCNMCGASGVHDKCGRDQISKNNYTCETCNKILTDSKASKKTRKATNDAFNHTMFMSKTNTKASDLIEVVDSLHCSQEQEHLQQDDIPPAQTSDCEMTEKPQTQQPSTSPPLSSQSKPKLRELFMFGKNNDIVGTVHVEQDKIQQKPDKSLVCQQEHVVEFSSSSKLLESIFSDIVAEGRELSDSEEMVEEVFDRFKSMLETFGDEDAFSKDCFQVLS